MTNLLRSLIAAAFAAAIIPLSISAQENDAENTIRPPSPPPEKKQFTPAGAQPRDAVRMDRGLRRDGDRNGHRRGGFNAPGHPLMFALESGFGTSDFTEAERTRLKALAKENPQQFNQEMRRHFKEKRRAEAQRMLDLRKAYLEAKDEPAKAAAKKALEDAISKDMAKHMEFQKKMLDETERSIQSMQARLDEMKKQYAERTAKTEDTLKQRFSELTGKDVPKYILRDLNQGKDKKERPRNTPKDGEETPR